jgi:starch synthase
MSNILYISSEAFPLVKTGGLGDVAGSLPAALKKKSQNIRLVIPAYPEALSKLSKPKVLAETSYYNQSVKIIEAKLPGTNVTTWLVDCPPLFDRPGGPYIDEHGNEWHDNALRFTLFCHTVVDLALNRLQLDWQADIVHCNDWQTGLVPALLSLHKQRPATIFTIHNLAYQGVFEQQAFYDLNLPNTLWHMDGLEFYNQLSFIKGGLAYADKITTVSQTYATEIREAENGYGLNGLLQHREKDLLGILNGIDEKHWNPDTDHHLKQKYNRHSLDKKVINKTALQEEFNLPVNETIPLLGMVSRLVEQKGLDIILQCIPELMKLKLQIVILGTGELHYEMQLSELAQKYPDKFIVKIGYNERLAHRIEAASDMYLMPSRFEPCGLNQLYSLRYATLPIATHVGGLADTVIHASEDNINNGTANGFILVEHSSTALFNTIKQAINLYNKEKLWQQLQLNAISCDHSWESSAEHYINLYQQVLEKTK